MQTNWLWTSFVYTEVKVAPLAFTARAVALALILDLLRQISAKMKQRAVQCRSDMEMGEHPNWPRKPST